MHRRPAILLLASFTLLTACRPAKVGSYRVPKEKPEEPPPAVAATSTNAPTVPTPGSGAPAADMASMAVPTANGSDLTWIAPAAWKAKPSGAMRKGSFAVPGVGGADADLSITAFPGDVGGELANVNRWRGQIQLAPLGAGELAAATTRREWNGFTFVVVDFVSPSAVKPARIVGAILPFNGATWFFKLMGPDATVAAAKPAFLEFLQTVRPPVATAQ